MYIDLPKKFITLREQQTFSQWSVNSSSKSHALEIEILTLTSGFLVPQVNFLNPPKSISYRCALSQGQSGRHLPEKDEARLCKIQSTFGAKPQKKHLEDLDSGHRSSTAILSHLDYFEWLLKGQRQLLLRFDFNTTLEQMGPFTIGLQFVPHSLNKSPLESLSVLKTNSGSTLYNKVDFGSFQQSQMLAPHPRANEICNPTTVYHLNALYKDNRISNPENYRQSIAHCLNHKTQLFGLWPQALLSANLLGLKGKFTINTSLKDLIFHLQNKGPVGISIKYGKEELPNSPLVKTSGHLITLIHLNEKEALVLDSAENCRSKVLKTYPTLALLKAWVRHHRLAYFFDNGNLD